MTLEQTIAVLIRAGFDVDVTTFCDALWLATQLNPTIDAASTLRTAGAYDSAGSVSSGPRERKMPDRSMEATSPPRPVEPEQRFTGQISVYPGGEDPIGDVVKASPIRVPAGAALPGRLALLRAMRPFTQRWPSPRLEDLDEQATVDTTAEQGGHLAIVFRRRPERWYEAALVVEDSPSMDIWHETLNEFEELLLETGAFRDVRRWRLALTASKTSAGKVESELRSGSDARMSPDRLASGRARRLIFLATHGISPRWTDGSMARILDRWSQKASVVILHMLPPHLWERTALGEAKGLVRALVPGAHTAQLILERFTWELSEEEEGNIAIPVIPLEPQSCADWAQMQMGRGRRIPALLIRTEPACTDLELDEESLSNDQTLVSLFRSHGSSLAFRLAVYLSPGPFTLPVARLIQAAKFGTAAQQSQLAELFLSGLVRRITPIGAQIHPDWVQYEVRQGAGRFLLRSLTEEDAQSVLDTLQAHVGRFIEQTYGKPTDFQALIRDPQGEAKLPAWAQPFATIGTALIRLQNARASSDVELAEETTSIEAQGHHGRHHPDTDEKERALKKEPLGSPLHISDSDDSVKFKRRVIVAGTGSYDLPENVIYVARAVGRMLAVEGYDAVDGGWQGVDYLMAESYASTLDQAGIPVDDHLTHVLEQWQSHPDYRRGKVVRTPLKADALIVIGGAGATGEIARQMMNDVPVLPVRGTGGDALDVFNELFIAPLRRRELLILDINIDSPQDAVRIASNIASLLRLYFNGTSALIRYSRDLLRHLEGARDAPLEVTQLIGELETYVNMALNNKEDLSSQSTDVTPWIYADCMRIGKMPKGANRWRVLQAYAGKLPSEDLEHVAVTALTHPGGESDVPGLSEFMSDFVRFLPRDRADSWTESYFGETVSNFLLMQPTWHLLPIAERTLRPTSLLEYNKNFQDLISALKRLRPPLRGPQRRAYLLSRHASRRMIGYAACKLDPEPSDLSTLVQCYELERAEAQERTETRPLWLLLERSQDVLRWAGQPKSEHIPLKAELERTLAFLESTPHIDSGRECRQLAKQLLDTYFLVASANEEAVDIAAPEPKGTQTDMQTASTATATPVKVYCSYAHEDEALLEELVLHTHILQRQGLIDVWYDRKIGMGADWKKTLDEQLNGAQIILLLISAHYLASDFCYNEMTRAWEKHEAGDARVVPIILRPCYWSDTPVAKLQMLPRDARPVTDWQNRDEAFASIMQGIQEVVSELNTGRTTATVNLEVEAPKSENASQRQTISTSTRLPRRVMLRAAILIGVDRVSNLPVLEHAANGARRMYEWALAQGMAENTHAKLITDADGTRVQPDLIYDAVKEIIDGPGVDQLIVYFAGYALNINRSEHWLLTDAPIKSSAAVNVSGSVELARYCGISHIVFISDTCRIAAESIGAQRVMGMEVFPHDLYSDRAYPVDQFYAQLLGRPAAEPRDITTSAAIYQGVYTDVLLEGLSGRQLKIVERSDEDPSIGHVSARRLASYLQSEVPHRVKLMGSHPPILSPDSILTSDPSSGWLSEVHLSAPL